MKQITSIYAKQHRKIQEIFETAGSPGRVLCVSMDYAKAKHVVLFCNGFGDVFKKPFPVDNLPSGFKALLKEVKSVCKERKIKAEHVFFGGEDNPSYVQNFTQAIWQEGYFVARVNALEAKNQRDNHQASTDELDVFAIAKTLLNKPSYAAHDQPEIILNLKEVSRCRSQFVKQLTKQKLQIHQYVDRLCPGFLDQEKSGVTPFSQPSLALLNNNFSVEQIRRRTQKNLTDFLERNGQNNPQAAAIKLKALATQALPPLTTSVACWQISLTQHVLQCQGLQQSIACLEKEAARLLAQTSGALFTSISGVGIVLASGVLAELGDPTAWKALRFLASYSGIVPKTEQTGGPDKAAKTTTVHHHCNLRAKNWILQIGCGMGKHGSAELKGEHQKLLGNGQNADFIMGKRLLRIFKDLAHRGALYRPKHLLDPQTPPAQLAAHYLNLWDHLVEKWRGRIEWEELIDPRYPLGKWRQMAQSLYKISLPVPQKKASKAA